MVYVSDLLESNEVIITSTTMPTHESRFKLTVAANLSKHVQEDVTIAVARAIAQVLANSVTVQNSCGSFSVTPEG